MTDVRILAEVAARAPKLQIACPRCERRGCYRLDALVGRHGADADVRVIVPDLVVDCSCRDSTVLVSGATCCFQNWGSCSQRADPA